MTELIGSMLMMIGGGLLSGATLPILRVLRAFTPLD
jgi:hypothetical protein